MQTGRMLLAAVMLASLGCVTMVPAASAQQAKTYKVGAAVYGLKNEYAQLWVQALKQHRAVKSGLVNLVVFDGRYDHLTQDSQFDNMIIRKFDAAIYVPIDSNAAGAVIKKAAAAGLPVVGSNGPSKSDQLVSYVGSDDVKAGEIDAEAVIKAMGGSGNVVVFDGPVGQVGALRRWEGVKNALDRHATVRVIEKKTANWSRDEAMTLMQNWITAHPGQINGVIALNDEMGLGAIAAMKAAGLDVKKIPVAGIDGVSDAIRSVAAGEMILSIRQDAVAQSQGALDVALRKMIGPTYRPMSAIWAKYPQMPWGDGTAPLYDVPWTMVTLENAKDFL